MNRKHFVKYILIISFGSFLLLSLPFPSSGQFWKKSGKEKKLNWRKKKVIADTLLKIGSYYSAIDYYKNALNDRPWDAHLLYHIAESYRLSRNYQMARDYYGRVLTKEEKDYPLARYHYAQMLKMTGEYLQAKEAFTKFRSAYNGPDNVHYKKLAKNEMDACDFAVKASDNPLKVKVENPGSAINSKYTDFAPIPLGKSRLLFSRIWADTVLVMNEAKQKKHLSAIFEASFDNPDWTEAELYNDIPVIDEQYHIANGAFSPDKTRFYFTKCDAGEGIQPKCAIYVTERKEGAWSEPVRLGEEINNEQYTSTTPTISPYKNGIEILYFVSDRPEGEGGLDIWYSVLKLRKGEWGYSRAKNAGRKINTPLNEFSPFYDAEMATLYFSSAGFPGLGGYDIFSTKGIQRRWSEPKNLGFPINSSCDDIYFASSSEMNGGFLVSNRPGTTPFEHETCCFDIFRFDSTRALKIGICGNIYEDGDTSKPLTDVHLSLYVYDDVAEDFILTKADTVKEDQPMDFKMLKGKIYKLVARKEGYFTSSVEVNTNELEDKECFEEPLVMQKVVVNKGYMVKNVYYDFDRSELRDESKRALDSLTSIIIDNHNLVIEIGSHTDSKGTDSYNINLSQKRAQSVVDYLVGKGIAPAKLVAKGYGETQPIAPNTHPDGSDNPEGRQKNRRTEFKVIGELDGELEYSKDYYEEDNM